MGAEYKYLKDKDKDFSETVKKILDKNPQALLYIIGPDFDEKKFQKHERMKFLGVKQNPLVYQRASDIYLEGFPFSSFTALLETVLLGVCPVLMYSPHQIGAFDVEMGLSKCLLNAGSEEGYINQITELINQPDKRRKIAAEVKTDVSEYHYGAVWHNYLGEIYAYLSSINHQPKLIENAPFLTEEEDLYLVGLKNNHFQFNKYPIWIDICLEPKFLEMLSLSDITKMLLESFRIKDSKSLVDLIRWRYVFSRKISHLSRRAKV